MIDCWDFCLITKALYDILFLHSSPCAKVSLVKEKPINMLDFPCLCSELQQGPCQAQAEETRGGYASSSQELGKVGSRHLWLPPARSTDPFSQEFCLFSFVRRTNKDISPLSDGDSTKKEVGFIPSCILWNCWFYFRSWIIQKESQWSSLLLTKASSPQGTVFTIIGIAKARPINKSKSLIMPKTSNESLFRQSHTLR